MLASSDRISSWTPLKPQYGKPNPYLLANELWCIDFLNPPTPLIITHRLPAFLESLMPLKNSCSIHARWSKSSLEHPYVSEAFFPSLKHNFIAYHFSKLSDCIFEIHQLWQSDFSRVYSNSCRSCFFESEIIKIGESSYNMYSNNKRNFQESTTILNAHTKIVWKLLVCTLYIMFLLNEKKMIIIQLTAKDILIWIQHQSQHLQSAQSKKNIMSPHEHIVRMNNWMLSAISGWYHKHSVNFVLTK